MMEETGADVEASSGAKKACELLSMLFNNTEQKRGFGSQWRAFTAAHLGKIVAIPKSSSTRFFSYGRCAAIIISHRSLLMAFLHEARSAKQSETFNNLERNCHDALADPLTVLELRVHALYHVYFCIPILLFFKHHEYARQAHEMAEVYHFFEHGMISAREDPELYLYGQADYDTFGHPLMDSTILNAAKLTPNDPKSVREHAKRLFTRTMEAGILACQRFTKEYQRDGALGRQRSRLAVVPMQATNDCSESAFGMMKKTAADQPNARLAAGSTREAYKVNHTGRYLQDITNADRTNVIAFAREEARKRHPSKLGEDRIARQGVVEAAEEHEEVRQKKAKKVETQNKLYAGYMDKARVSRALDVYGLTKPQVIMEWSKWTKEACPTKMLANSLRKRLHDIIVKQSENQSNLPMEDQAPECLQEEDGANKENL